MDTSFVKNNIKNIFARRKITLYALALSYAGIMLNYFRSVQPPKPNSDGKFWHNRTGQASARMKTEAKMSNEFISLIMSHGVQYGTYLELANDRTHAAIYPIITKYFSEYMQAINKLYRTG